MKNLTITKLAAAIIAASCMVSNSYADDQPTADSLVGKFYGGIHGVRMENDEDRYSDADPEAYSDHGSGFGGELGYRYSPELEIRFSYTHMNWVMDEPSFIDPGDKSIAFDFLYFPTAKNAYFVGGVNHLDIVENEPSVDFGGGYRHYMSNNLAIYLEGKGHYQPEDEYLDYSGRLGLIYFYGETLLPSPVAPAKAKQEVKQVVRLDSDKDGVFDEFDKCSNTPMSDKVDAKGCTIFTEETSTMSLLVNFDNNKSVIRPEYMDEVKQAADFLNKYPHVSLTIEGHTSKQGAAAYNKKLSQERADAIVEMLVDTYKIDASRLSAVGYGEERLLTDGNSKAAHAKNRRIEAKVEVTTKKAVKK